AVLRKICTGMQSLNGQRSWKSWKLIVKKYGRSMKWKEQAENLMLQDMIKIRTNIFLLIAPRKVPKAGEVFVLTAQDWSQGKNTNRKITLLIWQQTWA